MELIKRRIVVLVCSNEKSNFQVYLDVLPYDLCHPATRYSLGW